MSESCITKINETTHDDFKEILNIINECDK